MEECSLGSISCACPMDQSFVGLPAGAALTPRLLHLAPAPHPAQVDLLSSEAEVEEVVAFVRENASRLLSVRDARVLPVSARSAMQAKLASRAASEAGEGGGGGGGGALSPEEAARLAADPAWQLSRFESLERFIYRFLVRGGPSPSGGGSSDEEGSPAAVADSAAAGESVRLKLQTPLFVAEALVDTAARAVGQELESARADVASLKLVRSQLQAFKKEMAKEGQLQVGVGWVVDRWVRMGAWLAGGCQ